VADVLSGEITKELASCLGDFVRSAEKLALTFTACFRNLPSAALGGDGKIGEDRQNENFSEGNHNSSRFALKAGKGIEKQGCMCYIIARREMTISQKPFPCTEGAEYAEKKHQRREYDPGVHRFLQGGLRRDAHDLGGGCVNRHFPPGGGPVHEDDEGQRRVYR
jgi:hypothetical protein